MTKTTQPDPSLPTLRLGTRASALAVAQSQQIADRITALTGHAVELVRITTHGDVTRASLSSLGGTGVFAMALRDALLAGECDFVVHSLKDLPTAPCPGLTIAAIPERADARDTLCGRDGHTLQSLREGARVGTGSPRRVAQLRALRPDLVIEDIRGNIDTRLGRIRLTDSAALDAVVLAAAGLTRLGRTEDISEYLELTSWPSAPGQGALAIETREDSPVVSIVSVLDHPLTRMGATAERAVLRALEAGCAAPVGVSTIPDQEKPAGAFDVVATVYALDGSSALSVSGQLPSAADAAPGEGLVEAVSAAERLGSDLAAKLLGLGAAELAPLGPNRG
ncbi:hydroxymethylbilane synthase [Lysinibacter cavernae]|uniref:Hydroxymethylbilane synthase n=1 Tax=Lysinibacter cavernae TaxID=1640652 RepID=A0A7X5R2E1_9MICO|nr:hydroxymethylbilane synthase [Lysinibacter cavernae]